MGFVRRQLVYNVVLLLLLYVCRKRTNNKPRSNRLGPIVEQKHVNYRVYSPYETDCVRSATGRVQWRETRAHTSESAVKQ